MLIDYIFFILFILVFGRLALFAFKLTWGITKILLTLIFLPVIIIFTFFKGLLFLAFPLLIVVGIVSFLIR